MRVAETDGETLPLRVAMAEYLDYIAPQITPKTLAWYEQKLRTFTDWCVSTEDVATTADFRPDLISRFFTALLNSPSSQFHRPRSAYTINGYEQVLRQFAGYLDREGLVPSETRDRIIRTKRVKRTIKTFTKAHLALLFAAADAQTHHRLRVRDQAILSVLLDTGIRASELCGLVLPHVHLDGRDPHLLVRGKGDKEREVGLGRASRRALSQHIYRVRPTWRDAAASSLVFLSEKGGALTVSGLDQLLYRLRARAGADHFVGVRVSAHTFRHTFALRALEASHDVYTVSKLLGHGSVVVTQGYLSDFQSREARRNLSSVLDSL